MTLRNALSGIVVCLVTAACFSSAPEGQQQDYVFEYPDEEPDAPDVLDFEEFSWRAGESHISCRGYLTRVESDGYCSDELPKDWETFEFNGELYFFQPLAGVTE